MKAIFRPVRLLLAASVAVVSGQPFPLTGDALPPLIKLAVGVMPAGTVVNLDQIVIIRNMPQWLDEMRFVDLKQRQNVTKKVAFTLHERFPIYINGDREWFKNASKVSPPPRHSGIFVWAAILVHESIHARGEASEIKALQTEINVLHDYERSGFLKGAEGHVRQTEQMLEHERAKVQARGTH